MGGPRTLPIYRAWIAKSRGWYRGWYDSLNYLMVRGTLPERDAMRLSQFQPFKTRGHWTLYRR